MTDEKDGQAFPFYKMVNGRPEQKFGMTLRQWYAGMALSGMAIGSDGNYSTYDHEQGIPEEQAAWKAKHAFRIADAMIEEGK